MRKKEYCLVQFSWKSLVFGRNSLKMSVSFVKTLSKVLTYSTAC